MKYVDDLKAFIRKKQEDKRPVLLPGARKEYGVGKHFRLSRSKPNLIDPKAKSGPVKVYTQEEIKAYEEELRRKGLI